MLSSTTQALLREKIGSDLALNQQTYALQEAQQSVEACTLLQDNENATIGRKKERFGAGRLSQGRRETTEQGEIGQKGKRSNSG